MIHEQITHTIIGAAMTVHNKLGSGFQEVIYQRALALELEKQNLSFTRELEMEIFYDEIQIGVRRVDFFVENEIMVELKALTSVDDLHIAQIMNYCQVYKLQIGLLLNFGSKKLQYKRIYNTNHPENIKSK